MSLENLQDKNIFSEEEEKTHTTGHQVGQLDRVENTIGEGITVKRTIVNKYLWRLNAANTNTAVVKYTSIQDIVIYCTLHYTVLD